jgi:probable phosphoglycerate mutase
MGLKQLDFPVYFARHGETIYNVDGRYQGNREDSALTPLGREQAHDVATILRDFISLETPPRFVSSPIGRACATIEIVLSALELPRVYTTDRRLAEIDLGEWTGCSVRDIESNDPRWKLRDTDKWSIPAPGGENYAEVAARATEWFSHLTEETVAIGHGAFGRILRGLYYGATWQQMSKMDEPHGVVYRFDGGVLSCIELAPPSPAFDANRPEP